ncbi:hypothetical protein BaRGS_00008815 [Batillaria attramentaria]|uniref:Uncharacterized protein n=1 Tax=Batillaria attramentaria TaxID=370345 RepID=A0ABD0LKU5_9CAEN
MNYKRSTHTRSGKSEHHDKSTACKHKNYNPPRTDEMTNRNSDQTEHRNTPRSNQRIPDKASHHDQNQEQQCDTNTQKRTQERPMRRRHST